MGRLSTPPSMKKQFLRKVHVGPLQDPLLYVPKISVISSTGVAGEAFLLSLLHPNLELRPAPSSTVVVELDFVRCVNC